MKISYQRMQLDDINTVMQIETSIYPYPWSKKNFKDCIHANYDCWLARANSSIIAYAIISIAAGESHILNISIAKEQQGHGIGKQFIEFLVDVARNKQAEIMILEVRTSNIPAIRCYTACGFNEIGYRKNYYPAPDGHENARLFGRQIKEEWLPGPGSNQGPND